MKKNDTKRIAKNTIIQIMKRKCSDKIQPEVKVGMRFLVKEQKELSDGTPVLVLYHPDKKGIRVQINAKRFTWQTTSFEKVQKQQEQLKYKAEEKAFNKMLQEKMSNADTISVVYVPHVVEVIAVRYLRKCMDFCREHRFSEYRKISRFASEIERLSYNEQMTEIKPEVYKLINQAADFFCKENERDVAMLEQMIGIELGRAYPQTLPEGKVKEPMRIDALTGLAFVEIMHKCYLDHDNVVTQGVGELLYEDNKRIIPMRNCFLAYAGNVDNFNFKEKNIRSWMEAVRNRFVSIKFDKDENK